MLAGCPGAPLTPVVPLGHPLGMSDPDLTPADREELARLEVEVPRLERLISLSEAGYADKRPRFEAGRKSFPPLREEEVRAIQGLGQTRDDLQLARADLHYLQGKGPRPNKSIELRPGELPPLNFQAALAAQSRAEVGHLDYIEGS